MSTPHLHLLIRGNLEYLGLSAREYWERWTFKFTSVIIKQRKFLNIVALGLAPLLFSCSFRESGWRPTFWVDTPIWEILDLPVSRNWIWQEIWRWLMCEYFRNTININSININNCFQSDLGGKWLMSDKSFHMMRTKNFWLLSNKLMSACDCQVNPDFQNLHFWLIS